MASKKVKVDFTGVESFNRASEGQHVVKIATAEMRESQGGNDMISVAFEVTKGQDKGARVFENYPLAENALWKLKGMLQAIGMKCEGKVQLDLDKLVGKLLLAFLKFLFRHAFGRHILNVVHRLAPIFGKQLQYTQSQGVVGLLVLNLYF